jgi:hypothetical protein
VRQPAARDPERHATFHNVHKLRKNLEFNQGWRMERQDDRPRLEVMVRFSATFTAGWLHVGVVAHPFLPSPAPTDRSTHRALPGLHREAWHNAAYEDGGSYRRNHQSQTVSFSFAAN